MMPIIKTTVYTDNIIRDFRGKSVAVVGNGTPEIPNGLEINEHDIVVRFNNYVISGYEDIVGTRCDLRVINGWKDIEHRSDCKEATPFTEHAPESVFLEEFRAANHGYVWAAEIDIHYAITLDKPSTGLAFVVLCRLLGVKPDVYGFDGFRTPHYWKGHTQEERKVL